MSTSYFTECDVCGRKIVNESYLRLTLTTNQHDNRAFIHVENNFFRSAVTSTNGRLDFDVCQTCAPKFGVERVKGDPEFAAEARADRKKEILACTHSMGIDVSMDLNVCDNCRASESEITEASK